MKHLGLKHLARELAEKSNVPLLPGTGVVTDIELAVSEANNIKVHEINSLHEKYTDCQTIVSSYRQKQRWRWWHRAPKM